MHKVLRAGLCPRIAVILAVACASCGGDESDQTVGELRAPAPSGPPPAQPEATSNRAPTIGGVPRGSVVHGTPFEFVPTAADADGDSLTFTITNEPAWASFDPTTGRLFGTPGMGDIGIHADIRIAVSDGTASVSLRPFAIEVVGTALGSATLSWTPPTQRSDGSPLTNLAGFKVYWGTALGDYPNVVTVSNPGVTTYVVDQLTPATWFFVTTAVDSSGVESGFSNVASKTIR